MTPPEEVEFELYTSMSRDQRLFFEQHRLGLGVMESLLEKIAAKTGGTQVTAAELAKAVGTTRLHATQSMEEPQEMKLRTIADFAFELGYAFEFKLTELQPKPPGAKRRQP